MARWVRFLIAIIVGAGLGLVYGWLVNPVEYIETTPDTLRVDYRTDYVLMVAEAYQGEQDLDLAVRRIAILGDAPPAEIVYQAILFAQKAGYSDVDLERMQALLSALQALNPLQGTPPP
jgi:hypothetical protein